MSSNLQGSALESYLVREVQTLCDADPDLVAQYISALITSGDPPQLLRQSLDDKLREFFGNQTVPFIDRLFKELGYDSNEKNHNNAPERSRRLSDYSDEEDDGDRNFKHRRPRTEARDDSRYSRSSDDRHHKRHIPDGYHKRNDDYRGRGIPTGPAAMYQQSFDGRSRGGRGGYRGDMGRPSRPLCRDYNEKGFCMRGDMCPYDHGADRIVVDDGSFTAPPPFPGVSGPMGPPMSQQQPPFFGMPTNFDAYDPERATLMPSGGNMTPFPADMPGMMMPDGMPNHRMYANPRGRGRGGRGGRGRGGMPGGSHQKRQSTSLVVENIPPEFCEISKVNEYFKKFGSLTNISVQGHLNKAILQFSTNTEASAAYNSPDPIFDNRFVKVYWHKENEDDNKDARAKPESTTTTSAKRMNEPDPEEVAARAAEFAKQREEKQKKHQERMKAILDMQKQKEQLLQKQIEEQKRLMEKLTNSSNMTKTEKEDLLKSLKKINSEIDISRSKPVTYAPPVSAAVPAPAVPAPVVPAPAATASAATAPSAAAASSDATASSSAHAETSSTEEGVPSAEELHAKLAKLEAEAANLGITGQGYGGFRGGRGGYYGRGRGWPRARGGGMPRYTLDNRPTKFHVKGATEDSKDEMRKHFEQFGNVTAVEPIDDGLVVEYSQRFEAEKAMAGGANTPLGKLEFSWYTGAIPSNGSPKTSAPTPNANETTEA